MKEIAAVEQGLRYKKVHSKGERRYKNRKGLKAFIGLYGHLERREQAQS